MDAAVDRLKQRVDPELLQLFEFHVQCRWPATKVARKFGVGLARVYYAKHKISRNLKREIQVLRDPLS